MEDCTKGLPGVPVYRVPFLMMRSKDWLKPDLEKENTIIKKIIRSIS
jgi:hypothetical protein